MAKNDNKAEVTVNIVETTEEKVAEKTSVVVIEPVAKDKRVKIKLKYTFRQFIGDRWFEFTAGEERLVPEYVKEMLQERGALDVI